MNEQQLIDLYMLMGKSKAEATRLAQAQLAGGLQANGSTVYLSGPTTANKTVGGGQIGRAHV